jgi:acetolactate synthase small subunit
MRHTIRLWVYDRPGVLDRITGVIRRRGINIKTLTTGDTQDGVSQITISLGDPVNVQSLGQVFSEMSSVQHWEECTPETHVVRELLLMRCPESRRGELPEGARVFKEEGGVLFVEYVTEPDAVGEIIQKLRQREIACVRTGALGLSKQEGTI